MSRTSTVVVISSSGVPKPSRSVSSRGGPRRFGHWRRTRPFWAGVFLIGSDPVILVPPDAPLRLGDLVVSISTLGGASALIIGVMLIVIGISVWIRPQFGAQLEVPGLRLAAGGR